MAADRARKARIRFPQPFDSLAAMHARTVPILACVIVVGNLHAGTVTYAPVCEDSGAGAVAGNLRVMSAEISEPWQEGGAFIEDFANARGVFLEADDVLVAILESLGFQSEFIADRKLKPALPAYRNVQGLESHYAEHTAANIAANLAGFRRLFDSDVADAYRLRDYLERAHEAEAVTALIAKELETAEAALLTIVEDGKSLEEVVRDEGSRDVEALYDAFQKLSDLTVEAAVAAGVELGFNFQDGD